MIMAKTKKELFGEIMAVLENAEMTDNAELKAFVEHEVELLTKKTINKKLTKAQEDNITIKDCIECNLRILEKAVTIKEIQASDEDLARLSNQKMSSILKKLIDEGTVVRTEDKRVAYFAIAQ